MEISNLNNIPGSLFYLLKNWSEQSVGNYNLLIVIAFAFVMLSSIFLIYICLKIGRSDERTLLINLKGAYVMLVAIILCDMIFPKSYLVHQFFMLKYGIACFAAAFYLAMTYRKDLK